MKFAFTGICELVLTHTTGDTVSKNNSTNINLEVSSNLDKSKYLGPDRLPTQEGGRVLLKTFVQGVGGTILYNHAKGWQNKDQALAMAIAQLTELVQRDDAEVENSKFEDI